MNKDIQTLNNINKIQDELIFLSQLSQKIQEDHQQHIEIKRKIINSSIQDLHEKLQEEKASHSHQLLLYLGRKEKKQYYICPICEEVIIRNQKIKNKYIIDISSYIDNIDDEMTNHNIVKLIISHVRNTIQRYNKLFTKVIIEEVYKYLQNQIDNQSLIIRAKKHRK